MSRSKIEVGNDHRNEGFTAADAMNEHNYQKTMAVHKPNITKPGLPFYSTKELEKLGGEVTSFNMSKPVTMAEFKKMTPDTRKLYIENLCKEYDGINTTDIAKMLGGPKGSVAVLLRDSGIRFPRGGYPGMSEGRIRFAEEMIPKEGSAEEKTMPVSNAEPAPGLLTSATFHCDASEVAAVVDRLGMTGMVYVKIYVSNKERGKQDDGFN